MTKLETLQAKMPAVQANLALARSTLAVAKPEVEKAEQAFIRGGKPQDGSHPLRQAWNAALREYDNAQMNYNNHYITFSQLRGQIAQEETAVFGSTGMTASIARTAPEPDVEKIRADMEARRVEAEAKKATANPAPELEPAKANGGKKK